MGIKSSFVISLDFELIWGVRDKRTLSSYGKNIEKVHVIIPRLLDLFDKYEIKATFSTVGLLFGSNRKDVLPFIPTVKPSYVNKALDPYSELSNITDDHLRFYFADRLIERIIDNGKHEIGTHTFSHYYCNEEGQTLEQFDEDLKSAVAIANHHNCATQSIVFPRNQVRDNYLSVCKKNGIVVYRGNDDSNYYNSGLSKFRSKLNKVLRSVDSYISISGNNAFKVEENNGIINVRASRFLRPYSKKLRHLEKFKIRRICTSMEMAARNNLTYHLWWHPHNFGSNTDENFSNLELILKTYSKLNKEYGMESKTMNDFIALI